MNPIFGDNRIINIKKCIDLIYEIGRSAAHDERDYRVRENIVNSLKKNLEERIKLLCNHTNEDGTSAYKHNYMKSNYFSCSYCQHTFRQQFKSPNRVL